MELSKKLWNVICWAAFISWIAKIPHYLWTKFVTCNHFRLCYMGSVGCLFYNQSGCLTIHFPPLLLLPTSGICLVLITGRYIFNTRTIFNSSFNQLCISVILQYFSPMNYFFPFQKNKTVPSRKTAFDILQIILLICYMYMYIL